MTETGTTQNISRAGRVSGAAAKLNIFSFSSKDIALLAAKIDEYYKQHPEMIARVRPLDIEGAKAAKAGVETVSYKTPVPVEVHGQETDISEIKVKAPGYEQIAKSMLGTLYTIYELSQDPGTKKLAMANIKDERALQA